MKNKLENRSLKREISLPEINTGNRHLMKRSLYISHFNRIPNCIIVDSISSKKWHIYAKDLQNKAEKRYYKLAVRQEEKQENVEEDYYLLDTDILIDYCSVTKKVGILWSETDQEKITELKIDFLKLRKNKKKKNRIKLIIKNAYGLETEDFKIPKDNTPLEDIYNDDFIKVHELIGEKLNIKNGKGLLLLHGIAGTGKTNYVRNLVRNLKKQIIFLPSHLAGSLVDPGFLTFLMKNKNSILVVEDAENILLDRDKSGNASVSTILNITDGILADCLNIQIICTFNTHLKNVDKALLRKGRLIAKYEFGKLDTAKSNSLSEELGFDTTFTSPQVLTNIYNQEERTLVIEERVAVGFR